MVTVQIKQGVAGLFRQAPWLGALGTRLWMLQQARYTIGVVGVLFDEAGRILLLEHVFHPIYPWGLPGGWMDRDEAPATTVVRELREETGLHVRAVCPLLTDLGLYRGQLDMAYLCQLEGGEVHLSSEILTYCWSDPASLPDLWPFQRRAIERALRWREAV